jgi:D-glycerate 3-kinase
MELAEALIRLGMAGDDEPARVLFRRLAAAALPADWCVLAAALARALVASAEAEDRWPAWRRAAPPRVIGLSGGQGAGKTTLARALADAFAAAGTRTAVCALDDFYLSRQRRAALANHVHPLLATRGVPGTHEVTLLCRVLDAMARPGTVEVPVFDKAADDRLTRRRWRRVQAPVDVVVLEGWCLGARPQLPAALQQPLNGLESEADADGIWRRWVNAALAGPYAQLWQRLHLLVYLQVPDLGAVLRWRGQQERGLPPERRMSDAALARFVAHYERITRAMQADLPMRADVVVRLDDDHRIAALDCRAGAVGAAG